MQRIIKISQLRTGFQWYEIKGRCQNAMSKKKGNNIFSCMYFSFKILFAA